MSLDARLDAIEKLTDAGLGSLIVHPGDTLYDERIASYWSKSQHVRPWFIVRPKTSDEVSRLLTTLISCPDCKFAVRSGGHTVWTGGSNIADGVTVDLGAMNEIVYNQDTKIASIQPGARWIQVYEELDKHGVVVAGGRDGNVGVGGYLTGGGISWFLPRFGFSCNQVVNFEVVLADGGIVQANREENPDLYQVLKGASGNFGIVTRVDLLTFVEPLIWGGTRLTNKSTTAIHIKALIDFTANLQRQPENHCGVGWSYQPDFNDIVCLQFMSNTKGVERPAAFEQWLRLPAMVDTTERVTVAVRAKHAEEPDGYYTTWLTSLIKNNEATVAEIVVKHNEMVEKLKSKFPSSSDFWTLALFQPMPGFIGKLGRELGGNIMGLDRIEDDALLVLTGVHVKEASMFEIGDALCKELHYQIDSLTRKNGTNLDWVYVNYADASQDPFRYAGQENVAKIKAAAQKYDPSGVFQTRCLGGFKISQSKASG
ncbi:uncharacterized protein JN550_001738 [Neoarthrinium moseri]|uniref:uncharacterized protein n=1 Tax=Neoarthrinium moseri TaxID=1658444 RepID=UPI001FDBD902|nr:uncharacterized protein JN550_001738 [Neoarthrinium moseri]KAI1876242.1 hypothetical protein JN550_001738 [Neoarthrinium moseri]